MCLNKLSSTILTSFEETLLDINLEIHAKNIYILVIFLVLIKFTHMTKIQALISSHSLNEFAIVF